MRLYQLSIILGICAKLAHAIFIPIRFATPVGFLLPSQVHLIPTGATIVNTSQSIQIVAANGTVLNSQPLPPTNSTVITKREPERRSFESGWVAYGFWENNSGSPISSFSSIWTVPPLPSTDHGQTLFLFNSIEPSARGDSILQPVLQYGPSSAGGGKYWAIASWYVVRTANGYNAYYTPLYQVSPGQSLYGGISLVQDNTNGPGLFTYICDFWNMGSGTYLKIQNSAELRWATETLEVYNVQANTDYPTLYTQFYDINIETQASYTPSVTWSTVSDTSDGVLAYVTTDGSTEAIITIQYPIFIF